ncbi:hypothetical protein Tco_0253094 [Tanacetum coccineum]
MSTKVRFIDLAVHATCRNMQNQGQNLHPKCKFDDMLSKFVTANTASTSGSGTLPGNTVTNPKEDLKGITTRSGVTIQGPKAVNHDTEVTKDTMHPANNGSTENVHPPECSKFRFKFSELALPMPDAHGTKFASTLKTLIGNKEKLSNWQELPLNENWFTSPQQMTKETWRPWLEFLIPYPRVPLISAMFLKTSQALIDVLRRCDYPCRVGKEAITFNLDQTSKYTADYNHMTVNKIDVIDMACDEYSQESKKELKLCEAKTVEPSIDEPPEVELKELPPHLEYAVFKK